MTVGQYFIGISATLAVFACAVVVGIVGRRLLAPRWKGAPAALVAVVVGYAFLLVEGELLGTFGAFSRGPIVICSVLVALAAVAAGRRFGAVPVAAESGPPSGWTSFHSLTALAASAAVILLLAQGLAAVRATAQTGNLFIDALEYHLTFAAQFATSHHTGSIVQVAPGSPVSYYPLNSELLHGMGIALFHRDTISLLLTLLDISVALLAAWCVGSAYGVGPVALCAVSPMLAVLGAYDASAINDWAAVWPLIALLAIAVHHYQDREGSTVGLPFVAGIAAGLAMGAKLSLLAPAGALLIGYLIVVPGRRRVLGSVAAVVGAAVASIYWYLRDLVAVGSPLPSQHIPGLNRIPMPGFQEYGYSVAHYLGNTSVIRHFFRPGLEFFFGKAWPAVILLAAGGVILAVVVGPGLKRMVGVVAVIATVAYLVTPTGAFGPPGHPYLFGYNVRYALPAVALGLLLVAMSKVALRWPCQTAYVFLAVLVVTLLGPRMWTEGTGATIAAVVVAAIGVAFVQLPFVRRHGVAFVVVGALAVAVVGYPLNHRYLADRYASTATPKQALYHSVQKLSGQRIGVVGSPVLYPFEGATYTNSVSYVGQTKAHHEFADYATCPAWRAAVAADHYGYVVVEVSSGNPPPPALTWTQTASSATLLGSNAAGSVFTIGPGFGSEACAT